MKFKFLYKLTIAGILGFFLLGWTHATSVSATPGAATVVEESKPSDFMIHSDWMARYENWDWFGDNNDSYAFDFVRARIYIEKQWDLFQLKLVPQFVYIDGLPEDATLPKPQGPSGMGGLYYLHNQEHTPASAGFHEASVLLTLPDTASTQIQLGRFTYASGLEYTNVKDGMKFNTLKNMRLADRLISSFEWSAFARAFDGLQIRTTLPGDLQLSGAWMAPTQGGWEKDFNQTIQDIQIGAVTITAPKDIWIPETEIGLFLYHYQDDRDCSQRVDNSGSPLMKTNLEITTIGFHAVGLKSTQTGQFDYLLWGTHQWGNWYELDQNAYALALESGYQWTALPAKPWIRAGLFFGSGDGDSKDGDHETFFQMAPGTRKYQLFPYYDLQNNQSIYAQCLFFPSKKLKVRLDYAINRLADSNDLWYMGTGPTQSSGKIFGYIGRPSGEESSLSSEVSAMLTYSPKQRLNFQLFLSHVWAGDIIQNLYPGNSNATYLSLETNLKF